MVFGIETGTNHLGESAILGRERYSLLGERYSIGRERNIGRERYSNTRNLSSDARAIKCNMIRGYGNSFIHAYKTFYICVYYT